MSRSQSLPQFHEDVPTAKLLLLITTGNEILGGVFEDFSETLQLITRRIHSLLDAESCAIFLALEDQPGRLTLSASYTDVSKESYERITLNVHNVPKGGLTGSIAHQGKNVRLHGRALYSCPYIAGKPPVHLASGICFSVLGVPLIDQKGRVWGVLKVDNKKDANGRPAAEIGFSQNDEALAVLVAGQIVAALRSARDHRVVGQLGRELLGTHDLQGILGAILQTAVQLVRADRADVLIWSESAEDLIVSARCGESSIGVGERAPKTSVVRSLWHSVERRSILIPDISDEREYYAANSRTRSEVAVRLEVPGRSIGVLNVESFSVNHFDAQDCAALERLADYAAKAVRVVEQDVGLHGLVDLVERLPSREEILRNVLNRLREGVDVNGGAVYAVDDRQGVLRCVARVGDAHPGSVEANSVTYHLNAVSIAAHVYRTGTGYFCENPATDRYIDSLETETLGMKGPAVAVPIVWETKTVGVLTVWGGRVDGEIVRDRQWALAPYLRLAAWTLVITAAEQFRTRMVRELSKILQRLQTEPSVAESLQLTLAGIRVAGFDRVRLFEWDRRSECFILVDFEGMAESERGYRISPKNNRYVADLVDTCLDNPRARLYEQSMFGGDPDAAAMGRPEEIQWAVVPLLVGGKLYGYVAADNAMSRRAIARDSLEYMSLLGGLGGFMVANAGIRERFLESAFHNLSTPVHSIAGICEALDNRTIEGSEWTRLLRLESERLLRLTELVKQYTLGRRFVRPRQRIDLGRILQDGIDAARMRFMARGITISMVTPAESCDVMGDADGLLEVLDNLLQNALAVSRAGDDIQVVVARKERHFHVSVIDQGPGVPEEEVDMIFRQFVSIPRGGGNESTGLGLSIARATIVAHGGALAYETGPTGAGACFHFTLPAVELGR